MYLGMNYYQEKKDGNKYDSIKMFEDEKTKQNKTKKKGFQRLILFIEIFANGKRFGFLDLHQVVSVIA